MSSCLIVQTEDEIYIGTDTATSTFANGKYYRVSLSDAPIQMEKLSINDDMILCVNGYVPLIKPTFDFVSANPTATHDEITCYLRNSIAGIEEKPYPKGCLGLGLVICKVIDGQSFVYNYEFINDFVCDEFIINDGSVNVIAQGYKTDEMKDIATRLLLDNINKENVINVIYPMAYEAIACNEIGGGGGGE